MSENHQSDPLDKPTWWLWEEENAVTAERGFQPGYLQWMGGGWDVPDKEFLTYAADANIRNVEGQDG